MRDIASNCLAWIEQQILHWGTVRENWLSTTEAMESIEHEEQARAVLLFKSHDTRLCLSRQQWMPEIV